jgi:hypothetical protein
MNTLTIHGERQNERQINQSEKPLGLTVATPSQKKTQVDALGVPIALGLEKLGLSDLEKSSRLPNTHLMNNLTESLMDKQKIKRNQFGKSRIPKKFSSPTTSNPTSEELTEASTTALPQEETKKAN